MENWSWWTLEIPFSASPNHCEARIALSTLPEIIHGTICRPDENLPREISLFCGVVRWKTSTLQNSYQCRFCPGQLRPHLKHLFCHYFCISISSLQGLVFQSISFISPTWHGLSFSGAKTLHFETSTILYALKIDRKRSLKLDCICVKFEAAGAFYAQTFAFWLYIS